MVVASQKMAVVMAAVMVAAHGCTSHQTTFGTFELKKSFCMVRAILVQFTEFTK